MNTENFLELITTNPIRTVCVAKSSIAAIEDNQTGCTVTLKEKRPHGTQISFQVNLSYVHLKSEINRWEKLTP